jgi:hypothetical protein
MAKYDSSSNKSPTDEGSTSANSLVSPRYGYAVLGGVNPEASQKEAGAQQPKLHPTRDFRQGDLYQSQVKRQEGAAAAPTPGEQQHSPVFVSSLQQQQQQQQQQQLVTATFGACC